MFPFKLVTLAIVVVIITPKNWFVKARQSLEVYWESYLGFPNDAKSCLLKKRSEPKSGRHHSRRSSSDDADLPLGTFGLDLKTVLDYKIESVNIAFADFNVDRCERSYECNQLVCGLNLFRGLDEEVLQKLKDDIKVVQSRGVRVILAFGGEQWGNIEVPTRTTSMAERVVEVIVASMKTLGVDGVDLVQHEGCGWRNLRCADQVSVHLYVLEHLRQMLPAGKSISYTFPVAPIYPEIDFPFRDVIKYGHKYLDAVNIFGSKSMGPIQTALDAGVPANKIIWGLPIGCNKKHFHNVSLTDLSDVAKTVKRLDLKGLSIWSINRDTDQRVQPHGSCQPDQTGLPNGSYIHVVADIFD